MILSKEQKKILAEIKRLKKEKNALILVHNYQRPEIYEAADFIGDSLMLCVEAMDTNADLIVFCGVNFMAESAAILNPGKKVVVPFIDAGCAMADMVDARKLSEFKKLHPNAAVVTYVNSSAEVKALSDVCCTSSNAVEVVRAIKNDEIIFVPDKNLADFVQRQVPKKKIIPWDGFCPIHNSITGSYISEVRKEHPKAKILAHPECRPEILEQADHITSTSGMIDAAKTDPADEFFVLTECGMTERLNRELPAKRFYGLCNMCFDMKKNTLESIIDCLKNEKNQIEIPEDLRLKAMKSLEAMFAVS